MGEHSPPPTICSHKLSWDSGIWALGELEGDVPLNVNYLIGFKNLEVNNDNKVYGTSFICKI